MFGIFSPRSGLIDGWQTWTMRTTWHWHRNVMNCYHSHFYFFSSFCCQPNDSPNKEWADLHTKNTASWLDNLIYHNLEKMCFMFIHNIYVQGIWQFLGKSEKKHRGPIQYNMLPILIIIPNLHKLQMLTSFDHRLNPILPGGSLKSEITGNITF